MTSTSPIADAMATASFSDAVVSDASVLYRQYTSLALTAGQTITGGQALKAQYRCSQTSISNDMFVCMGIRVVASDGSTIQKVVLTVLGDSVEILTVLTNHVTTRNSAATNYTTVAGDRLVIEVGLIGTPVAGGSHSSSIRFGDDAASDLPEDNTTTTDLRPWVQLTDTLTFVAAGPVIPVMMNQYRQRRN